MLRLLPKCATIAVALHVSACKVAEKSPRFDLAFPVTYDGAREQSDPVRSNPDVTGGDGWWHQFGSTELDRLIATALTSNPELGIADAKIAQAEANVQLAHSNLFPALSYQGGATRTQTSGTTLAGVVRHPPPVNTFGNQLVLNHTLDIWGRNGDAVTAELHSQAAQVYQKETTRLSIISSVVNGFLELSAAREREDVAKKNLANAERILNVIARRVEASTASMVEFEQQRAVFEAQRQATQREALTSEQLRLALAANTGLLPQGFAPKISSLTSLKLPRVAAGMPSDLLTRRPDLKAVEAVMAAAQANISVARKAFLPAIALSGNVGNQSGELSTLLRPESLIWSIALGVAQTIFDGDKRQAQVRLTEAQRDELLLSYRKTVLRALVDVEAAMLASDKTQQIEAIQDRIVSASSRALDFFERRLASGVVDVTALLSVQATLFAARSSMVDARLARHKASLSLFLAVGGDWHDKVRADNLKRAQERRSTTAIREPESAER